MAKFMDLGIKRKEEFGDIAFDSKQHQNETIFPSFSIRGKVPEELFKFDPNDDVRAEVILRIKNKGTDESKESKKKDMSIQVVKIKVLGKNKMTKDEFKKASDEDRDDESKRLLNV